jgi:nascent polypeptide-associated complex subunit beta
MREQLLVATGNPESKQLKDMIPEILKQVGPQQYEQIQGLLKGAVQADAAADDDDVPDLVAGTNFEQVAASK